jgi:AraC-like DNA-binding protein
MQRGGTIQSAVWHYPNAGEAFFTKTQYSHHHFQPHFHTHYVFFCVARGINEGSFNKKRYTVTPDDFLIIHPGEIHSGNSFSNRSLTYYSFCPTEKFLLSALQSMPVKALPSFSPVMHHANLISQKFITLVKNSTEQEDEFLLEQSLADFLGTLVERTCKNTMIDNPENIYREKISKAKKFIEDNYINDFSLAELSCYTGLSPYHLLRSFKTVIGLTPYAYLYNYRIEMAKRKIDKKISLTELAHYSGFYDQSHFIRHFKKINGIAPSAFKKS